MDAASLDPKRDRRPYFYDGGTPPDGAQPGVPADRTKPLVVLLERESVANKEDFRLRRRIAYDDAHCGEIIVPPRYEAFTTDLTSVPDLFSWLVPKTGNHLPAALVHDGLVTDDGQTEPTYISTLGLEIDRVEADRIFRDAMRDSGTGLVRRWMIWSAVTCHAMVTMDGTAPGKAARRYYQAVVVLTLLGIGFLGYVATADMFDRTGRWWLTFGLPWIDDGPFVSELLSGAAGAIVLPGVTALAWGRFRRAGWITGIGVAVLLHVTIGVVAVTALYNALEYAARKPTRRWAAGLGVLVGVAAIVRFATNLM